MAVHRDRREHTVQGGGSAVGAAAVIDVRLELVAELEPGKYDAVILAVAHRQFVELGAERIRALGKPGCVLFDVKQALPRASVDDRL